MAENEEEEEAGKGSSIEAIERLAEQVSRGEVVFFVGAGFSVDSEGNTASCLICRLLVRLLALTRVCTLPGLRDRLRNTFALEAPTEATSPPTGFPYSKRDVDRLAEHYYEVNDWFCATFAEVLEFSLSRSPAELGQKARQISAVERAIAPLLREGPKPLVAGFQLADDLEHILPALGAWARAPHPGITDVFRQAGKAMFLDTLGFRDGAIMRGAPEAQTASEVLESYEGRILPRHQVIARLAREGLCGTTVTANYDLLLEGAFRVSGFGRSSATSVAEPSDSLDGVFADRPPMTTFAGFARIADATEFFSEAKALNTPAIVKMHGSVDRYRHYGYEPAEERGPLAYLQSMVFTYREIQNWRGEAWVADFLRTVLRTRTVAFVGYSLQDPVIHDTFRTVYEEMTDVMRRSALATHALGLMGDSGLNTGSQASSVASSASGARAIRGAEAAPAYFFAPGTDKREFHGIEILQAASAAVAAQRAKLDHPNYIRFHYRGQPDYPNIDELFVLLQHGVLRRIQRRCLKDQLRRTAATLLGSPRRSDELEQVLNHFEKLLESEKRLRGTWQGAEGASNRHQHARLCGWTDCFIPCLLREFAAVDLLQEHGGPGTRITGLRRVPYYYPASQDPRWTCWASVVELAIRRLVRAAMEVPESLQDDEFVWSARSSVPTVFFAPPGRPPCALVIYLANFDLDSRPSRVLGLPVRHHSWRLTSSDSLWPRATQAGANRDAPADRPIEAHGSPLNASRSISHAPSADWIWRWAAGEEAIDPKEARRWLALPEDYAWKELPFPASPH